MNFSCQSLALRFFSRAERLPQAPRCESQGQQPPAESEDDTIEVPRSPVDVIA